MLTRLRRFLPHWLKKVLRFATYPEERRNFFRERRIRTQQDANIRSKFDRETENLIIFFVPGADRYTLKETISGGVLSLVSLCEETAKLSTVHHAQTFMCTFPREYLLLKHLNFENSVEVYRFEQIVGYFKNVKNIILHLPDDVVKFFLPVLFKAERNWLKKIPNVHINIVNANILLMPSAEVIREIEKHATITTMTAAHAKYCNRYYRRYYGLPLHLFSTWVSPEQYLFREYDRKENIMVVSPDTNPAKEKILTLLKNKGMEVITLKGLTHKEFKETIARAKWALTFGEGLDGYLVEPVFSGTVGFAVYNEDFFTEDFKGMTGIYSSYDDLTNSLLKDIETLDNFENYTIRQREQFELCARYYNYKQYQENIRKFYLGEYTFK
jgi:hypothetical protein